jgi:hypothetical protein
MEDYLMLLIKIAACVVSALMAEFAFAVWWFLV